MEGKSLLAIAAAVAAAVETETVAEAAAFVDDFAGPATVAEVVVVPKSVDS